MKRTEWYPAGKCEAGHEKASMGRESVVKGSGSRPEAPYALVDTMKTPAIFRARETLSAMQAHMRGMR